MPLLIYPILGGATILGGGYILSNVTEDVAKIAKYGAYGLAIYAGAKYLKVI